MALRDDLLAIADKYAPAGGPDVPPPTVLPAATDGATGLSYARQGIARTGTLQWGPADLAVRKAQFEKHLRDDQYDGIPTESLELLILWGILNPEAEFGVSQSPDVWRGKSTDWIVAQLGKGGSPSGNAVPPEPLG